MRGRFIFGAVAIIACCSGAKVLSAVAATRDYSQITTRNLFGLHEPIIKREEQPPPPLPKIVLNGITTMGSKLAFLKVQSLPKPGEQPQAEQSFTLTEGQREGGIEILEINERAGTVRLNNFGTEMTLGFDKDADKTAKIPQGTQPASNLAGGVRAMNPGTSGYQRMIPTRTGRQVSAGEPPPLPPSTTPQGPGQTLLQKQSADKPLTPEEQAILRELEQATQAGPKQPR